MSVSVTATLARGRALYGLYCNADPQRRNGYFITVDAEGNYTAAKAVQGRAQILQQSSAPLVPPLQRAGGLNRLRVDCEEAGGRGTRLRIVANDVVLIQLVDADGLSSRMFPHAGLYLQSLKGATAHFDDFAVGEI